MINDIINIMGENVSISIEGSLDGHYKENDTINPASLIKLSVLYGGLKKIDQKLIGLDDIIPFTNKDLVAGCGSLKDLSIRSLSLKDLLMLMITVSDNSATNILMDYIGLDFIQASINTLGLKNTYVKRKLYHMIPGVFNESTSYDTLLLLKAFDQAIGLSESSAKLAMDILSRQQLKNFTDGLEYCPLCHEVNSYNCGHEKEELITYSKSGEITGHVHDSAIIKYQGKTVYISILTYKQNNNIETRSKLRQVGQMIYDRLKEMPC